MRGHRHTPGRSQDSTVKIGNEWVTYRTYYCATCGEAYDRVIVSRRSV